jgi:3-phenylpropionate/trans-cinnamate dioxygenase ferredoxin component
MAERRRVRIAAVGDVPVGEGRVVEAQGKELALFNVDGTYHVMDNMCVHRGGPLAEGELEGRIVSCPWHAWRWDVTTGANVNNPAVKMTCFPVTVEQGAIFVELP